MKYFVSTHNPSSTYLSVSSSIKEILGYDPNDLINTFAYDKIHINDIKRVTNSHLNSLKGDSNDLYYRILSKSGKYILIRAISTTIHIDNPIIVVFNSKVSFKEKILFYLTKRD